LPSRKHASSLACHGKTSCTEARPSPRASMPRLGSLSAGFRVSSYFPSMNPPVPQSRAAAPVVGPHWPPRHLLGQTSADTPVMGAAVTNVGRYGPPCSCKHTKSEAHQVSPFHNPGVALRGLADPLHPACKPPSDRRGTRPRSSREPRRLWGIRAQARAVRIAAGRAAALVQALSLPHRVALLHAGCYGPPQQAQAYRPGGSWGEPVAHKRTARAGFHDRSPPCADGSLHPRREPTPTPTP